MGNDEIRENSGDTIDAIRKQARREELLAILKSARKSLTPALEFRPKKFSSD
jgi:hypothetical protein